MEELLKNPQDLLSKSFQKYQEKSQNPFRKRYSEEEVIQSIARALLQPFVQLRSEKLQTEVSDFSKTIEVKKYIESTSLPEVTLKEITNSEFNKIRRKYLESLHLEFADKLAPLVQDVLAPSSSLFVKAFKQLSALLT